MQPFSFTKAKDAQDAVNKLASGSGAKLIGGGTNIVDLMKLHIERPQHLIDITGIGMDKVEDMPDGGVRIGTLVRNSDLAYHPLIQQRYPVLSQALLSGASPQLRNMATVGGNLMQRTRCPYFYDTAFACNKRQPGAGCDAMKGYNRSHAILGTSEHCIATHPSDMCVALAALDAEIHVMSADATRKIPIHDFHLLPGDTPHLETALRPGEMIMAVVIPPFSYATKAHYLKVRDRASYEFALASAAVMLNISNGRIVDSRVALGGVGTKPWRSISAEKVLNGSTAGRDTYEKAADAALEHARPHEHNAFKTKLAKRTLIRALEITEQMS